MVAISFDTHAFIKRMTAAGMPEQQAETVADALRESRESDMSQLVTKADLRAEMAETKAEMMKWMIGALGLQTLAILGGLAALIRLLGH
ncbi:MAG: CCDC90 family protein [Alphaproteobacteria bacterium]